MCLFGIPTIVLFPFFAIYVFLYSLIYINIKNGINSKNYGSYSCGLVISLILSIISSGFKLAYIIVIGFSLYDDKDDKDDSDDEANLDGVAIIFIIILIIFIILDWLLTIILNRYKNKVKNLCSNNNIQTTNLNDPIIQVNYENIQNLNTNNNNFVQTNFSNNQNINSPYYQPYIPNSNNQPNFQNFNAAPYEQSNTQNPNFNVQNTDNGNFTVTNQNTQK